MADIGIRAKEGVDNVFNLGSGIPTRNIGLMVERARGVALLPTFTANLKEDALYFGGYDKTLKSYYTVKAMFDNLQKAPIQLFQMRVVGSGCVAGFEEIMNTTNEVLIIKAGRQGQEDVGTWANGIVVNFYTVGIEDPDNVVVEVVYGGTVVETFKELTLSAMVSKINKISNYILAEEGAGYASGLATGTTTITLAGGVYNAPVATDYEPGYDATTAVAEGMAIMLKAPINIIACPELSTDAFAVKAEAFCNTNRLFYVHTMPKDSTAAAIETFYGLIKSSGQSFIASYLNWMEVDDEDGGTVWIPATGYVLGAGFIRVANMDNDIAWSVPAGDRTYAVGILDFTHKDIAVATLDRYTDVFKLNTIRYNERVGFMIWTSRTASTTFLYESIHVRLETNWIIANLLDRNLTYREKLNTPTLRNDMKVSNVMWMQNIYNQGGIEQSISFDQACVVSVESSTENRKKFNLRN